MLCEGFVVDRVVALQESTVALSMFSALSAPLRGSVAKSSALKLLVGGGPSLGAVVHGQTEQRFRSRETAVSGFALGRL